MLHVKAVLWLGEFAYGASPEILNPHVALQVWAGTPEANPCGDFAVKNHTTRHTACGLLH